MFPTTIWTMIRDAGARDEPARTDVATRYREPVLRFLRAKGVPAAEVDDVVQDVFLRLFSGDALGKADRTKGRFRAYLLTIARRVAIDHVRRKRPTAPLADDLEDTDQDPAFDEPFALDVLARALDALKQEYAASHAVLERHIAGQTVDRAELWVARKRLVKKVRHEVAMTCDSTDAIEDELRILGRYLAAQKASAQDDDQSSPR